MYVTATRSAPVRARARARGAEHGGPGATAWGAGVSLARLDVAHVLRGVRLELAGRFPDPTELVAAQPTSSPCEQPLTRPSPERLNIHPMIHPSTATRYKREARGVEVLSVSAQGVPCIAPMPLLGQSVPTCQSER